MREKPMAITRRAFHSLSAAAAGTALLAGGARATEGLTQTHGLSAFGDLKYPAGFSHFDYANPDAPKGGTWSTGFQGTYDSFNPYALKGNPSLGVADGIFGRMVFDTLMTGALDEPDSYYGLIAESAEVADDRSFVIFNLRPEARFHDGSPVTSDDVIFTVETLKTQARPFYQIYLKPIVAVVAETPNRVRFDFAPDEPKRDLPMLAAGLPVFSKAHYQTVDFGSSGLTPPLGCGPYKIGNFEPGAFVEYDRVEDYWGKDLPVNRGADNFDKIRIDYFRDRTAAFEGFKAGTFLFNEEYWSKVWATGYTPETFPAIGRGEVIRDVIPDDTVAGAQAFWFNHRRPLFEDIRVREAIALAFDFEWSNERLFYGLYQRTHSFFQGSPMAADGPPSAGELAVLEAYADQLDPKVLTEPAYTPPVSDASGRLRRSLRKAGRLLDAAGWPIVDGVRQKDGQKLEFEYLLVSEGFDRIVQPIVKNLEKLGIHATVRTVDDTQYEKRMDDFDFDMTTRRVSMSSTPGVELRGYFHSASADQPGSRNIGGIKNPVIDALIDKIERAETREELSTLVSALDRVMRSLHLWVPQWNKAAHHIAYWDVFDRPKIKPRYDRGVIHYWWQDAEKFAKLRAAGRI